MVEVLIAGILMASALAAVGRLSVAALSSSAHLSKRAKIEAAINNNIQALQKEDSYLTHAWMEENSGQIQTYIESSQSTIENNQCGTNSESIADCYAAKKGLSNANKLSVITCDTDIGCACNAPDLTLRLYLESKVPEPELEEIERTFDYDSTLDILKIIYKFTAPEQQIGKEQREIEMTPNFASNCYQTS
ncbi:hypothetical protein [Synechococcus sp. NOUM97013]|uniref:hypothetical protein n=1 Tax=Synechococcus sp. NOUM97013 TaxID=1442555 RepID=UPI00185F6F49|nr:hypothetical protein [Synechococcus sp. NOUM97013]QNI72724.1 hypothetical protein SynNOUM97013_00649 [Synechococcus sp. NOUM97013]